MSKTVEQWLALGDDLPVELAKVFTPKTKHKWLEPAVYYGPSDPLGYVVKCQKCGHIKTVQEEIDGCSVPDKIKIDWNTAMEWFRFKADRNRVEQSITAIWEACVDLNVIGYRWWLKYYAQPKHYLIAAAMAVERKER